MISHKHNWKEIESNALGMPTKYKCVGCLLERDVVRNISNFDPNLLIPFDKTNSINVRIFENIQTISFIRQFPIGNNEKLHLNHLIKENRILRGLK